MKVALYCRVSTDEQARTGESITDQRAALERWANDNGHEVAGVYLDEGYSAHKSYKSRPALGRLLEDVQAGRVELIAFTKFDRWTRKASDYYKLQDILDAARVPWTAILEDYETVTASGRFKVGIMLSVNQHEAERTSERIKFTFAEKRRRGEIISGNMPKGYKLRDKKPVKDPEAAPGIAAFWRAYLEGRGLNASICAANASGLHLAVSSASFIIRNANAYSGAIQGVLCDPYITEEEAARVLSTRKTRTPPTGWHYLFSGVMVCAECGGAMGAHRQKWQHADGSTGYMVFYNCARRYRSNKADCQNSVNVREIEVEARLLDTLGPALDEAADRLEIEIRRKKQSAAKTQDEKTREALERKKRRAWEAYLDEIITKDEYKETATKLQAQIDALPVPVDLDEDAPRRIRAAMPDNWRKMYDDLRPEFRARFWKNILRRIEVKPDRSMRFMLRGTGAEDAFTTRIQQPDGYWVEIIKAKE